MISCYLLVFMPLRWIPHCLSSLLVLIFVIFWFMLMIFYLQVATLFCFNASCIYWAQNLSFMTWVLFIIFQVLRFSLLVWVLCFDSINIHLTSSLGLVCYLATEYNYFLNLFFEFFRFPYVCDNIDVDLRGKDERKIIKIKQKCDKINLLLVF
jgi:hypothetical protein